MAIANPLAPDNQDVEDPALAALGSYGSTGQPASNQYHALSGIQSTERANGVTDADPIQSPPFTGVTVSPSDVDPHQTPPFIPGGPATDATPPGIVSGTMSSYTPTLGTVSDKETVAGHVNDLLNKDNPLMQTARSQAAQAANSRGLLNSSMAVQSGEQAAINSALPIAAQDASTYHDTAVRNQSASNEGSQFNTGAENQSKLLGQSGAQEQILQRLRGDQATGLANIEANYKTLMQTSASATQLYSEVVKSIGALLDDPNTTADQKQQAINKQIQMLQNGLHTIGSTANVDLSSLLDFSVVAPPAAPAQVPAPISVPGAPADPNGGGDPNSGNQRNNF